MSKSKCHLKTYHLCVFTVPRKKVVIILKWPPFEGDLGSCILSRAILN